MSSIVEQPNTNQTVSVPLKPESTATHQRSSRLRIWMKRVLIGAGLIGSIIAVAAVYGLREMKVADERHAAFSQCGSDIKLFLKSYATALKNASASGDVQQIGEFYSPQFSAADRGKWDFEEPIVLANTTLCKYAATPTSNDVGTEGVLRDWQQYLGPIANIEHARLKINLIEDLVPDAAAVVSVKYVLDGQTDEGEVFQDRFFFRWHIEKASELPHGWHIVKDELIEGERTAGNGDAFQTLENTSIGIDYTHHRDPKLDKNSPDVQLKFSVIEHAFGGVSAVDVLGNDGLPDLLFLDGTDTRLYKNVTQPGANQPSFVDVTAEAGLAGIDQAHSGLFVDFDNDGDKDLFVTRYMSPCRLFANDGNGSFRDCTEDFQLDIVAPCVSACVLDYDRDGLLDIYIGVNGHSFDEAPDIPFYAVNGRPNILLRNVDGAHFEDVSETAGIGSTGWTLAVTAGDFDKDGWTDLAVANDFGRKVLYRNQGDGTFVDQAKEAGTLDFSGGMGIAFADLNGDSYPELLTGNIESGQRWFGEEITLWQYMRNNSRTKWIWEDLPEYRELYSLLGDDWRNLGLQIGRGNSVFENNQDGTFTEWNECHAKRAGWAWSVCPFDHDADGDIDLYVSNGWISGPNPSAPDL